jgi:hypothetical protein
MHDLADMRNRRSYVDKTKPHGIILYKVPLGDAPSRGIQTNDLVYQSVSSRVPKSVLSKYQQPVVSALNGLYCHAPPHAAAPVDEDDEDAEIAELSRQIRFVGVACTDTYFGDQSNTQTQVTVRTRGTHTILNNSTTPINFGDLVMWQIPTKAQCKTLAEDRATRTGPAVTYAQANTYTVQLWTVPYDHSKYDFTGRLRDNPAIDELLNGINKAAAQQPKTKSVVDPSKNAIRKLLSDFLDKAAQSKEDAQRRVFGRAISTAKAGQPFDILLF